MKNDPLISVVMPVFNSEKYLADAIESILDQTFTNFEFLIFDDGSTDTSPDIVKLYVARDKRIIADFSPINKGLVVHLNEGIRRARGKYIARMDSDDVSLPMRLEIQKKFLEDHPQVGVVGSSSLRMDHQSESVTPSKRITSSSYLFWQCFFTNPLSHPTVMYRKAAVLAVGGYDETKIHTEDYDLWSRLLPIQHFANIQEPLLKYREHSASVSARNRETQIRNSSKTLADLWRNQLGIEISDDEALFLKGFHRGYDDLPAELAYPAFRKLWTLRRMVGARFSHVDDEVHRDAFRRSIYLATRVRSTSVLEFMRLVGCLLVYYPRYVVRQIWYGRV